MHLKRLELKGFKSFPTKTEINFNEGITAIVGPNGSGKSNISDAVRWVLGEQSIKSLRGDKLEDVIFAGSNNQKPMNYCEVALTIDNTDQKLNIDFSEVTIKRRAYRNGESGFFLNDKSCRLKDIKELLLDTGIGKDGYSIIEQGKVDEILSNNPVNRRKVFDEACGISKYRYKKLEAEKNLKNTKENLERIEDIYIEIENRIKPLYTQQKKALRYLELRESLKKLEVNNYIREIKRIDKELEEIQSHKNVLIKELEEQEAIRAELEKNIDSTTSEIDKMEFEISKSEEFINSIKDVVNQNESKISLMNERINNSQKNIENSKNILEEYNKKLAQNKGELEDLNRRKNQINEEISKLNQEISKVEELNSKKQRELDNLNNEIESLKDNIITYLNEKQDLSNNLSTLNANVENINSRNETIEGDIDRVNNMLIDKNNSYSNKEENIEALENNLQASKNVIVGLRKNLEDCNIKCKNIETKIQNNNYSQKEFSSKVQIYVDMENHYEGFNRGVKEVLKNKNLVGICGALGQVITTSESYEKAIEASLGAYMQNIITENQYSAKEAINYLKKHNMGRVTFLPMNVIKSNRINENSINSKTKYISVASDLVQFDEKYRNIVENILGRTIVIDNIDNAIRFANETNHRFKVVTLDGDILNPGGSLTGGSMRASTNILSRKRLISDYKQKILDLKDENQKNHELRNEILNQISSVKKEILEAENRVNDLEKDIVKEKTTLKSIKNEISSLEGDREKLENEKSGLSSNLEYNTNKIEVLKRKIEEINEREAKNKEKIQAMSQNQDSKNEDFENIKKEVEALRLELVKKTEVFRATEGEIKRIELEIAELNSKIEASNLEIKALTEEIDKLDVECKIQKSEVESLNKQLTEKNRELAVKKEAREKFKESLVELNKRLKVFERQNLELKESEFKIDSKIERISSNRENYSNRLFEDYNLTYVKALELKDESLEISKKIIESLKTEIDSLGNINVDSIKEYKETKERYDFYSEQKQDLEESISAIEKIISDLESNMKIQFKEEFKKVNENFKYVYKRLFGGGDGELSIVDEENILESDILITAKPPGKKMKNLNLLSGGEKALTAISILFAILLSKPTPFCILDEIEAPLDDANIFRFGKYLKELAEETQFIAVTHRRGTMDAADYIYGVTMEKKAISKVISLNLKEAEQIVDII